MLCCLAWQHSCVAQHSSTASADQNRRRVVVRSRYDIDQDYISQWKEVTARDNIPKKVTPISFLWFIPVFVKYHIIPGPLRYLWWLTWSAFLTARYQICKRLVLQGQAMQHSACILPHLMWLQDPVPGHLHAAAQLHHFAECSVVMRSICHVHAASSSS